MIWLFGNWRNKMKEKTLKSFLKDYEIDIAMIVATAVELDTALNFLSNFDDDNPIYKILEGNNTFYCGLYGKYATVIVKTNTMGSMQRGASLQTTQDTINSFKPKAVIMGGIAFGKDPIKQNFGDILISDSIISYNPSRVNDDGTITYRGSKPNTDLTLFNRFSQEKQFHFLFQEKENNVNIHFGALLTGETLIDNKTYRDQLFSQYPEAIGGEMEGTGIYAACEPSKIPWIVIKSICDWADGEKDKTKQTLAATSSFEFIFHHLNSSIIFNSLNIQPYKPKEENNPEINIDAIDILNLLISKRDMKKLSTNKGVRNREKKVYYEYYSYEDNSQLKGFIFLGRNITLKNVFESFIEDNKDHLPDTLEIFLTKRRSGYRVIDRKKAIRDRVKEFKLDRVVNGRIHYIDEIIRDNTAIKDEQKYGHIRTDFIDQKIYAVDHELNKKFVAGDSLEYFKKELNSTSLPISIVVGSGGVGKTTFCDSLQYTITHSGDLPKKVFYIKGEKVVDFFLTSPELQILSLENLYELYKEETDFCDIDKEDFHLNYIAGNIIVIIDAIEEIESALNERFDLKAFFKSLAELHGRFYSTKIILTTREHFIPKINEADDHFGINYFELKGFEEDNLDAFLNKKYTNDSQKPLEVKEFLTQNSLMNKEGHIIPLFVDWVCKIVDRPKSTKQITSKYFLPDFQMDRLLINLIEREITKQSLNIDIDGMFKLLEEIVIEHKGVMPLEDFDEYIKLTTDGDVANYLKNPLFEAHNGHIKLKYDILPNMIKSRYLRFSILNKMNSSDHIRSLLKELYLGEGDLFNELSSLFTESIEIENSISFFILDLVKKFKNEETDIGKENIRKSISGLLYLLMAFNSHLDKNEVTLLLKKIYESSESIHGLFIYGHFYPISFTDIKVFGGLFDNYDNFIKCNFPENEQKIFSFVRFRNIQLPSTKKLKEVFFDETCNFIRSNIMELTKHENNATKLKSDQNRQDIISLTKYIETSQKSENLIKRHCNIKYQKGERKLLNKLISEGYIILKTSNLYSISSKYYDFIPSIKLGEFPDELEKIVNKL